jgi:hypothetical protein
MVFLWHRSIGPSPFFEGLDAFRLHPDSGGYVVPINLRVLSARSVLFVMSTPCGVSRGESADLSGSP